MIKRSIFIVLIAIVLAACAHGPKPQSPTVVDVEYVNAVERHARSAGVEVEWVNPPRRKRNTENQGN